MSAARNHAQRLRAVAVIERLAKLWPAAFSLYQHRRRPLKVGITADLIAACQPAIIRRLIGAGDLRRTLSPYCASDGYIAVAAGRVSAALTSFASSALSPPTKPLTRVKCSLSAADPKVYPGHPARFAMPIASMPHRPPQARLCAAAGADVDRRARRGHSGSLRGHPMSDGATLKHVRDTAIAVLTYAKQAKGITLITQATEIRMRAERRAGELLIETAALNRRSGHDARPSKRKRPRRGSDARVAEFASSQRQRRHPDLAVRQQCRMPGLRAD